jgi:hypothetical protein
MRQQGEFVAAVTGDQSAIAEFQRSESAICTSSWSPLA